MATKTFKVALSLDNPRIIQSGIDVRSFDKQSIKIAIELTKNSQTYQIPTGAQIKISLLKLARQEQKIILDVPFTSPEAIEWLVPDYLDGYQGEVRVGVYLIVGAENIDVGYFNIASSVSDIDNAAEEFTESVMQGWAIEDLLALQPQFQAVLDETTGKDVISAPEIILARDGAQTLGERLDGEKAEVSAQLAQKATYQTVFGMSNLSQEVKSAITGGSVAVVGKNTVSKDNIIASAVTPAETNFIVRNVLSDTLVDDNKVQTGIYYEWNTGNRVERSDYNSTGLIPCVPNSTYTRSLYDGQVSFWDKNGDYVSGTETATNIIVVPDDASIAFMRVAFRTAPNFTVNKGETLLPKDTYKEEYDFSLPLEIHRKLTEVETITNDLSDGLSEFTAKIHSKNLYNPVEKSSGGYYYFNSGVWTERVDIDSTGFIDARMGEKFIAHGNNGYLGGNVTFWDSNHAYVTGIDLTISDTPPTVITVPNLENIRYFKISFPRSTLFYQINKGVELQEYDEFEESHVFEKNIKSPNILDIQNELNQLQDVQNSFTLKKTMSYQDDYSYSEYRGKDTTFWTTHIHQNKFDGTVNYPKVRLTAEHIDDTNTKNVQQYVASNQHDLVINGGIFNTGTNITDGYLIIDGVIIQDKLSTTHMYQHTLAVMQNGTLKSFGESVTPTELRSLGVQQAVVGFIPIIIDGEIPNDDFLKICPHSKIKNPRQVIGQYPNGDYIIFTCDGRREGEAGMTLREAAEIMQKLGVSFAYNLDGGGSTQTFVNKKRINKLIENRQVPNVLVF